MLRAGCAGASSYVLLPGTVKTLSDLQSLPDQDLSCRKQVKYLDMDLLLLHNVAV